MLSFSSSLAWRKGTSRGCCFTAVAVLLWCRTLHPLFVTPQHHQDKRFMSGLPAELPEAQVSLPTFSHRIINSGKAQMEMENPPWPRSQDPHGHQGQEDLGFPHSSAPCAWCSAQRWLQGTSRSPPTCSCLSLGSPQVTLSWCGARLWDKTPFWSLASPGRDLGTSLRVCAPNVVTVPRAQVRPYLVGEAVGTRGLEVQVGLEQLQEAAVDLLQKGHVWGDLRTPLG